VVTEPNRVPDSKSDERPLLPLQIGVLADKAAKDGNSGLLLERTVQHLKFAPRIIGRNRKY
jgi:hypothetical protein